MPKKHLVLDNENKMIAVIDGIPPEQYCVKKKHMKVFGNLVDVWCTRDISEELFSTTAYTFSLRNDYSKLFIDVRSAVQQLQSFFNNEGTLYVALGGSPKLIKWLLKSRGFNVVTVNVSEVKIGLTRTKEFEKYLETKLTKREGMSKFVVMDFADTGASLVKIKSDIKELMPDAEVYAVAVGKSHKFDKESNLALRSKVDHVLVGIDGLQKNLYEQTLKLHILGRNKVKNPYESWSTEQSQKLDTQHIPLHGTSHVFYQSQKSVIPALLDLPVIDVKFEDLFDQDNIEDSDSDVDGFY